jgi:hypothetical protein
MKAAKAGGGWVRAVKAASTAEVSYREIAPSAAVKDGEPAGFPLLIPTPVGRWSEEGPKKPVTVRNVMRVITDWLKAHGKEGELPRKGYVPVVWLDKIRWERFLARRR